MSLFSKLASNLSGQQPNNARNRNVERITWKCRYCGITTTTLPGYIPGKTAGGPCRVKNGKEIYHEWQKVH